MDFRGYLQQTAPKYLAFTGNDARIDPTKKGYDTNYASYANTTGNRTAVQKEVDSLYQRYQQGQNSGFQAPNLLAGIGGGGSAPNYAAVAPNWDLTSIYNNAGGQAAGQVNPYYTSQLVKFQQDAAKAKELQDQTRQLNLQNLGNQLTNQLGSNELNRTRTSADTLQNEQQIGIAADQRQQDQGAQFDQARLDQAKQLAGQSLTTSGLGSQQTVQSQTAYNTQEQRQGAQDQQQVAAQELTKARTFEDLANSDVLAKQSKGQGEKQVAIDWDKFVQGQSSDYRQYSDQLETERLQKIGSVQKQLAQTQINDMISALSNPGQRAAAAATYGGSFR